MSHRLPDRPVTVPRFLAEYPISFVYVDDVARVIADVVSGEAAALVGDVVNLAYAQPTLLPTLLEDIRRELGSETPPKVALVLYVSTRGCADSRTPVGLDCAI